MDHIKQINVEQILSLSQPTKSTLNVFISMTTSATMHAQDVERQNILVQSGGTCMVSRMYSKIGMRMQRQK